MPMQLHSPISSGLHNSPRFSHGPLGKLTAQCCIISSFPFLSYALDKSSLEHPTGKQDAGVFVVQPIWAVLSLLLRNTCNKNQF